MIEKSPQKQKVKGLIYYHPSGVIPNFLNGLAVTKNFKHKKSIRQHRRRESFRSQNGERCGETLRTVIAPPRLTLSLGKQRKYRCESVKIYIVQGKRLTPSRRITNKQRFSDPVSTDFNSGWRGRLQHRHFNGFAHLHTRADTRTMISKA